MARVTEIEVEEIIATDSAISLDAFILAATTLVDQLLVGCGLSTASLKEIERWLSAHFYAIRDPTSRVISEEAGSVKQAWRVPVKVGLEATMYGQQAMMLDTTGKLQSLNDKKKRPGIINVIDPITT